MSPTTSITAPSTIMFNRDNYPLWALKMEMLLKGKYLRSIVMKVVPINETNKNKFQKTQSMILLYLKHSQRILMVQSKSAKQAWTMFSNLNNTKDTSSKMSRSTSTSMKNYWLKWQLPNTYLIEEIK